MSLLALTLMLAMVRADAPPPTDDQVRVAVGRSLPFLLEGGEQWREGKAGGGQSGRVCVTCHQIPMTIWSHNEARARGFKIERKRLDDLTAWSLQWCAEQKHPKTNNHTGGFLSTMQQMTMGRSADAPGKDALATYELFGKVIASMQKPQGFWKEGNQIKGKGTEREADEVDTMWVALGLTSLESLDKLPKPTLEASAMTREHGMAWLKTGTVGKRTDWLALRMLLEREHSEAKQVPEWRKKVLDQQNADGGWPLLKGEMSHPLVTGQALYALDIAGVPHDDAAFQKARKFLVDSQNKDGSWKARSRNADHVNIVTIHWGTAWATIGLIRTLPKQ